MEATQVHVATKRLDERVNAIQKQLSTQLDARREPTISWTEFFENLERDTAEWETRLRAGE